MALFGTKGRNEVLVIPGLNVVVLFLPAVDIAFDGVTVIADDEAYAVSIGYLTYRYNRNNRRLLT